MVGSIHEIEPLTANKPSSYNTVLVKNVDEQDHGNSSHNTTDQQHDAEYLGIPCHTSIGTSYTTSDHCMVNPTQRIHCHDH